jgi:hypothetical protein
MIGVGQSFAKSMSASKGILISLIVPNKSCKDRYGKKNIPLQTKQNMLLKKRVQILLLI